MYVEGTCKLLAFTPRGTVWSKPELTMYAEKPVREFVEWEPGNAIVWLIVQTENAAKALALDVAEGRRKALYLFECDCRAAWRAYPAPLAVRYHPYRVILERASTGFEIKSITRLV